MYYQWVCYVLFSQVILFYVPRYLQKTLECGRNMIDVLVDYLVSNLRTQNAWSCFIYEALNFINFASQIYFMDFFLDGEFTTCGSDVANVSEMESQELEDSSAHVFPKVNNCAFDKYGPSDTVEKLDGLCFPFFLIVNENIVFFWFWFIILTFLSVLFWKYSYVSTCSRPDPGFLPRTR